MRCLTCSGLELITSAQTLSDIHRSPAHCIEYVHLIQWQQERGAEEFDADEEKHMRWVYDRALQRAEHFGIQVIALGKWALSEHACFVVLRGVKKALQASCEGFHHAIAG